MSESTALCVLSLNNGIHNYACSLEVLNTPELQIFGNIFVKVFNGNESRDKSLFNEISKHRVVKLTERMMS